MTAIRPAAVAGMFYPGDPGVLARTVSDLLAHAAGGAGTRVPKAIIVLHAGYVYSGPVAASACARLAALRGRVHRVVLLGPAHRVYARGLALARSEIADKLGMPMPKPADTAWLKKPGATFVTLTRFGDLRGCIGSLEARRPLGLDVRENAVAAAFHDPRFWPLTRDEYDGLRVEVSLLSPAEALDVKGEVDALAALRPHIDGVVFEYGHRRSTFLPQVWEQLPQPAGFLAHLKRKAGLPADFWDDGVRLSRYTVTKWKEKEAARADS